MQHAAPFVRLCNVSVLLALGMLGPSCTSNQNASPGGGSGGRGGSHTGGTTSGTGGSSSGGVTSQGGAQTGGTTSSTGGTATGGKSSTGGATGGASSTGGAATGGTSSTGGSATGGTSSTAGSPAGGTTSATGGSATGGTGGGSTAGVSATAMVQDMGFGTNIGNTFDNTTTWETGWGQPLVTQAYIDGMAKNGIKTVRVPVAWDTYANGGVIDATKMNRVKQVVAWIEAAGMYSIVNIHWDGGWIFNESNANKYKLTDDVKTKFQSYWQQIATAFSSVGHKLIFEGMNEEGQYWVNGTANGTPDYAALNTMNQLFVTTVRAQTGYNTTRALLIAGFTTDIEKTCVDDFKIPTDPAGPDRIFLSLHYYTPFTFCGLDEVASWGSPQTTWGSAADKATLESLFNKLGSFSTSKKVPIILGEFGVTRGEKYPREPASRILWMESVAKACTSRKMVPVLWDTGSEIKRTDGSFSTELQTVMTNIK